MDTDQPIPKETTDIASSERHGTPKANIRFYECVFCKRGFSNAQALGGHMNIHRKDRAKPKQHHGDHSRFPFDVPARVPSRQLPLFAEGPISESGDRASNCSGWQHETPDDDRRLAVEELDLELRLGPEPSGVMGLRQFL